MPPAIKANSAHLPELIRHWESDEIVLLPAATVYLLVVHGGRSPALAKLRALKQFSAAQPLALLTRGDRAREVVELTPSAERMMAHFPYPVTMILPAKPRLPTEIAQGFRDVFVACPDRFIYDLVGAVPFSLACATAKIGMEPIVDFAAAQRYFADQVALIVDGGRCRYSRRGTLVDFTLDAPTIMNFGPVSVDDLRPLLPEIVLPSHLMK